MIVAEILFNRWADLGRTALVGTLAYVGLVVILRVSGKRTLSKMNAFDLIVTVALGSTLTTILLSKDVPLAEGLTAFALLIGLQYAITWLSVRSPTVSRLVKSEPTLLYRDGFLRDQMRRTRVVESEVRATVRSEGIGSMERVAMVVLETDGTFTAIQLSDHPTSAVIDVRGTSGQSCPS